MSTTVVVLNTGLAIVTNRIVGGGTEPKYIGWGTGSTAPTVTDTGLESPRNEARAEGNSTRVTVNTTNDTHQVVGTLTCAGSAAAIREMVLFDGPGSGTPPTGANAFLRAVFSAVNLEVGDSIQFTVRTVYDQA